jgi:hypothetical protein
MRRVAGFQKQSPNTAKLAPNDSLDRERMPGFIWMGKVRIQLHSEG